MEFAMEATTEWEIGGTHSSLGTGDKCPPPQISEFVWEWEGAHQCFIPLKQTSGDLKSHHFQA